MATKIQPLSPDATLDEQAAYWAAVVQERGTTGTEGRYAVKQLASVHAAQDAASGPNGFGSGEVAARAEAAAANAPKPAANPEIRYDANGNSLIPGTEEYAKGSTEKPTAINTTGKFGSATVIANKNSSTVTTKTTDTSTNSNNSSNNNYVTKNGVLSYNSNPFTGEYQGKYYANGKLETADQIKADFLQKYGEQAKFIASVPELGAPGGLLDQAIKNNWSAATWTTQFANTKWAAAHPGDIGLAEIKRISTPSEYNTEYNAAQNRISTVAASLGIKLTPAQLGQQVTDINSPVPLDQNAVNSGQDMTNWLMQHPNATDLQIQQQMAKYGTIDPTTGPGGAIKQLSSNLQSLAQQYGVYGQFSPDGTSKSFDNYATQQVAAGANISDPAIATTAEQMYKTAAINTYKPFADQINAGMKVSDLASPYINTLSSLLEVSPSDIQLGSASGYGSMISKAMMGDANGQPTNPYDFANQVRSQPEWLNTQNAHQTILGGVNQLISKMGF